MEIVHFRIQNRRAKTDDESEGEFLLQLKTFYFMLAVVPAAKRITKESSSKILETNENISYASKYHVLQISNLFKMLFATILLHLVLRFYYIPFEHTLIQNY